MTDYSEAQLEAQGRLRERATFRDDCWLFPTPRGCDYGQLSFRSRRWRAHRLAWFAWFGEPSGGYRVSQDCGHSACVNPAHLRCERATSRVQSGREPVAWTTENLRALLGSGDVVFTPTCWVWRGKLSTSGRHPQARVAGHRVEAYRAVWELYRGPIPRGQVVNRDCGRRNCVNPLHMSLSSFAETNRRGNSPSAINARKRLCPEGHPYPPYEPGETRVCAICHPDAPQERTPKTHCLNGHPRTPENLYAVKLGGSLACLVCRKEREKARWQDPEFKARQRELARARRQTPEGRAKAREHERRKRARRKARNAQ
ncbi:hypothetical protein ACFWB0_02880 [Rhodococcus sp. NPDC060086]|uniref:hypothetical protein n=1 Tax=Rhodococcus sp. NPDC060086 TaxID=3347055 RepID=UPI003658F682